MTQRASNSLPQSGNPHALRDYIRERINAAISEERMSIQMLDGVPVEIDQESGEIRELALPDGVLDGPMPPILYSPEETIDTLDREEPVWISGGLENASPERRVLLYNALTNADQHLADMAGSEKKPGETILLSDVIAHEITTGGNRCLRCVLLAAGGESYECVSEGIASSLKRIFRIIGRPPYDPPLAVQVCKAKTAQGFTVLKLRVVR